MKKIRLDIACGKNKKPGFKGVDIWDGADIVCDLEKFPWPFEDDSVDEISCSHYIEHTPDLISFANELYRIMKVGAKAEIIAPYYSSIRAWQDPTHLRAISEATFLYFNKEWRVTNKLDHYPITVDFDYECRYLIDPNWKDKEGDDLLFAIRHYINVVSDIHVFLIKRKPENEIALKLAKQASFFWEKGQLRKSCCIARKSLAIELRLDTLLMVGEYELKQSSFDSALHNFKTAIKIDADSYQANSGLIRSYINNGQHGKAKQHINKLAKRSGEMASMLEAYMCQG